MSADIVLTRIAHRTVRAEFDGLTFEHTVFASPGSTIKEAMEMWAQAKWHLSRGEKPPWRYMPEVKWQDQPQPKRKS